MQLPILGNDDSIDRGFVVGATCKCTERWAKWPDSKCQTSDVGPELFCKWQLSPLLRVAVGFELELQLFHWGMWYHFSLVCQKFLGIVRRCFGNKTILHFISVFAIHANYSFVPFCANICIYMYTYTLCVISTQRNYMIRWNHKEIHFREWRKLQNL